LKFKTGRFAPTRNGDKMYAVEKEISKLQMSSERYERDSPGKRLRTNMTYDEYVQFLGMSRLEYAHFKEGRRLPDHYGPKLRVNSSVFDVHIVCAREWYETLPAMRHVRNTEQSFTEKAIQAEFAGPDRINAIRQRSLEQLSDCISKMHTDIDLTVPVAPISPDGYNFYRQRIRDEKVMRRQMLNMKANGDGSTPMPETEEVTSRTLVMDPPTDARNREDTERSRSRGPPRN